MERNKKNLSENNVLEVSLCVYKCVWYCVSWDLFEKEISCQKWERIKPDIGLD
jgi:hypothetical protein